MRRQMRASDPTHVEKYFQLRVSLDAVPRGEVRAVLDAVVGAASTDVGRSIFAKRMLEFYEANKLSAFLDAVHLEIDRLQPAQVEAVIKAVADASETLAEPPLPERQMSTAAICTLRLAAKLPSSTANELLQRLVTTANRAYAVQVMLYSDASQHQSERLGFDFAALLGAFTVRIEREFLDESCDLFELYEYEWDSVLMLWRQPTRAAAYLVALLASTPQHWVSLASRALTRTAMSPTALSMEINFLREIISLQLVADAARDLDPHGFPPDDRALVALFREELLLVPQLVAELDSIATLAQELTKVSPNQIPAIDWSVRAWDRARPRLEPMLRSATWWSTLVSIYSSLTTMRAEFDAITPMSSPQEAVVALATAEAI